jgi:ABC-type multidrug transport system ATPase subunit
MQLARKIDAVEIELLPQNLAAISEFCKKDNLTFTNDKRYITISTVEKEVVKILRKLSENNIEYDEISINKPTLEDYFLKVSLNK